MTFNIGDRVVFHEQHSEMLYCGTVTDAGLPPETTRRYTVMWDNRTYQDTYQARYLLPAPPAIACEDGAAYIARVTKSAETKFLAQVTFAACPELAELLRTTPYTAIVEATRTTVYTQTNFDIRNEYAGINIIGAMRSGTIPSLQTVSDTEAAKLVEVLSAVAVTLYRSASPFDYVMRGEFE